MRVDFNTAKILKDVGFAYPHCIMQKYEAPNILPRPEFVSGVSCPSGMWCYNDEGKLIQPNKYNLNNKHYPAPLQSTVQKWLRDTKDIQIIILSFCNTEKWVYDYSVETKTYKTDNFNSFSTYEEALEEAIIHALKKI